MQADHKPTPASGARAAGKPVHAFPRSLPHSSGEEARDSRVVESAPFAADAQPADAASVLPQPLQPVATLFVKAHQPLHFLLQSALLAVAPFAEILGVGEAIARATEKDRS